MSFDNSHHAPQEEYDDNSRFIELIQKHWKRKMDKHVGLYGQ